MSAKCAPTTNLYRLALEMNSLSRIYPYRRLCPGFNRLCWVGRSLCQRMEFFSSIRRDKLIPYIKPGCLLLLRVDHAVRSKCLVGFCYATPRIQPSTCATARSRGVSDGLRYAARPPSRSARCIHAATEYASCWSAFLSSRAKPRFQRDG